MNGTRPEAVSPWLEHARATFEVFDAKLGQTKYGTFWDSMPLDEVYVTMESLFVRLLVILSELRHELPTPSKELIETRDALVHPLVQLRAVPSVKDRPPLWMNTDLRDELARLTGYLPRNWPVFEE